MFGNLLLLGREHGRLRLLEARAQPLDLLRVVDVHVFDADLVAVHVLRFFNLFNLF